MFLAFSLSFNIFLMEHTHVQTHTLEEVTLAVEDLTSTVIAL